MANFLDIVHQNDAHTEASGMSIPRRDQDDARLREELERCRKVMQFQEAKIAQQQQELTDRHSTLNTRERECDENAKTVKAVIGKIVEMKTNYEREVAQIKAALQQVELARAEEQKKKVAAEQYSQQLLQSLQEAKLKIHTMEHTFAEIQRDMQYRQGASPASQGIPYIVAKQDEKNLAYASASAEEIELLGYTPVSKEFYTRGASNFGFHEKKILEMENRLMRVEELLQSKQTRSQDLASSGPNLYKELATFLDYQ